MSVSNLAGAVMTVAITQIHEI